MFQCVGGVCRLSTPGLSPFDFGDLLRHYAAVPSFSNDVMAPDERGAATAASPQPRRVRRPSWLDSRLVVGVALVLASVVTGARVVSGAHRTYPVVAITHDAESGTVLGPADLRVMRVRLVERDVYLAQPQLGIGKRVSRRLSRGELIPRSALDAPPALTRVTVPFAADAAPALATGERVSVWLLGAHCPPVVVVRDVAVQRVRDAGAALGSGGGQAIDIDVPAESADRVLAALSRPDSELRAGVLTGSPGTNDETVLAPIDCPGGSQGS